MSEEEPEFTAIGQEDWPPDGAAADIELERDMDFESDCKDEFPGGW